MGDAHAHRGVARPENEVFVPVAVEVAASQSHPTAGEGRGMRLGQEV